jgi:hypothetical protein
MEVRNTSAGFVHLLRFDTILILFYLSLPGFAGRMSDAWTNKFASLGATVNYVEDAIGPAVSAKLFGSSYLGGGTSCALS